MVRVFINHVDTYAGKTISKVLANASVGGTISGGDNSDDVQQVDSADSVAAKYNVIGSLCGSENIDKLDWISEVVKSDERDNFFSTLMSCDVIVYQITGSKSQVDEAKWAVEGLHDHLSSFTTQKVFICISSVLTWARSKPLDLEEPDVPFMEEDYRRRRPHPNFKDQIAVEKAIIKFGKTDKSKFVTYVLASGLTYGLGENIFHFLFKDAWHGIVPYLQVYGDGQNFVPTIHIMDLASVVLNVADNRPKTRYIVAVDDSHNTFQEIVSAISSGLSHGKVKHVFKEDALLNKDISDKIHKIKYQQNADVVYGRMCLLAWSLMQSDYDQLLVNLQMDATVIKEFTIDWQSENGLVDNIAKVIREYKEVRKLLPIRVCILGPPAVGKTYIISLLCDHYKVHHIKIADVIKEAIEIQERVSARAEVESNDDETDEDDGKAQHAQEFLDLLKDDLEENGKYSDQYIIEFYKQKLRSMPCQNQGFILDGFPKTYDQAKALFEYENVDSDEDGVGSNITSYNKTIMPEVVVSLEASDEFLRERVMNLPQILVEGTHNTEEGFTRRLNFFHTHNEEDNTVLNFFDEREIHPECINIEDDQNLKKTFDKICKLIGHPRNYWPTPEELEEMERKIREELIKKEARERENKEKLEHEERVLRAKREAEWGAQLELVLKEEKEMLETRSLPLRNYLMQHIMPTLTEGLIEACKIKPDDPVDYIAEYLFKHNPQVD